MSSEYELKPSVRRFSSGYPARPEVGSGVRLRLYLAAAVLLFSMIGYLANADLNPLTGEPQPVSISPLEEVALGLLAVPQMVKQYGGFSSNLPATQQVQEVGARLVESLDRKLAAEQRKISYSLEFHLLSDPRVIDSWALPGGQIFLTEGMFRSLTNEGQLAGILGREIGHVLERHGAEQLSRNQLLQRFDETVGIAGRGHRSVQKAELVAGLLSLKYEWGEELESDRWGVELMALAGYDPEHLVEVMEILERTAGAVTPEAPGAQPPRANRRDYVAKLIAERFPAGKPLGLR